MIEKMMTTWLILSMAFRVLMKWSSLMITVTIIGKMKLIISENDDDEFGDCDDSDNEKLD